MLLKAHLKVPNPVVIREFVVSPKLNFTPPLSVTIHQPLEYAHFRKPLSICGA
jgi:hypothetical protein